MSLFDDPAEFLGHLPQLRHDGHKYDRGHAVVVSGDIEGASAARLAAQAALRIGAGLVTLATPPDALLVNATHLTAVMVRRFSDPASLAALFTTHRRNAIAIGPGMEPTEATRALVETALAARLPIVIDAGGLTAFASEPGRLAMAIDTIASQVVLTPHEGEFARLFPHVRGTREERALTAARAIGATIILKGQGTVIATADAKLAVDRLAPPTLATAGSGDVLTGFVVGLLAQGMPAYPAACAAVTIHALAARRFGPGLIAEDIERQVPGVLASLADQVTMRNATSGDA